MSPLPDWLAVAMEGSKISEVEAVRLEEELRDDPDDFHKRARLLGYYSLQPYRETRAARHAHVMWAITKHPASPLAGSPFASEYGLLHKQEYEEAKAAWLAQVAANPSEAAVLGNAAAFVTLREPEEAKRLFEQAQAIEPNTPDWEHGLTILAKLARKRRVRKSVEPRPVTPPEPSAACRRAHAKLIAGRCPHCGLLILQGQTYAVPHDWCWARGSGDREAAS